MESQILTPREESDALMRSYRNSHLKENPSKKPSPNEETYWEWLKNSHYKEDEKNYLTDDEISETDYYEGL